MKKGLFLVIIFLSLFLLPAFAFAIQVNFASPTSLNGTVINSKTVLVNTLTSSADTNFKNYSYSLYNTTGQVKSYASIFKDSVLTTGISHTCVLKLNGSIQCWGLNNKNQSQNYTGNDAIAVSAGAYHTCALKQNGSVQCWGWNIYGEIAGYNGNDAIAVSAGGYHTCMLKQNGNVQCWGDNSYKQSKNYTGKDAIAVSTGSYHTCVLKQNGNVECWGQNNYNQSLNYTGNDALEVSAGDTHTCVLKQNGNVQCWGSNGFGQGKNYTKNDAIAMSAGGSHTCALKQNGTVECWGYNGEGCTKNYTKNDAIAVSVGGGHHTCVVKQNGSVQCWGNNEDGQTKNYTGTDVKKTPFYVFTGLAKGRYFFNATVCSTSNNCNATQSREVFLNWTDYLQFTAHVVTPDNSGLSVDWEVNSSGVTIANGNSLDGTIIQDTTDAPADLTFKAYADRLQVTLHDINISLETNKNFGLDKLPAPAPTQLVTYGVNNSYSFSNATIMIYYDDTIYSNESNLKLYKCDPWNFAMQTCTGSWYEVSATQNKAGHYFSYVTTSFSGFGVVENIPSLGGGSGGIPIPAGAFGTAVWFGNFTQSSPSSSVAHGGQVSQFYLSANASTHRWQGYVGNVSGVVALGNGSDILLNFGAPEYDAVFATYASGIYSWGTLTAGEPVAVDNLWGFAKGKDMAINIFNASATFANLTSAVPVTQAAGNFITGIFNNGTNSSKENLAFGAQIYYPAKTGLGGNEYQYELIVPTPTDGDETYYFYLRLAE